MNQAQNEKYKKIFSRDQNLSTFFFLLIFCLSRYLFHEKFSKQQNEKKEKKKKNERTTNKKTF